jgi:hypothetical protein
MTCENMTARDAALLADIARNNEIINAKATAEMEASVAAIGPIPDGWEYWRPVRDSLTRAERRAGAVAPIVGWAARRASSRGDKSGWETLTRTRDGIDGTSFEESSESRDRRLAALAVEAESSTQTDIHATMDGGYAGSEFLVLVERRALRQDGTPFARKRSNGTGGFYPWEFF